MSDYSSPMFIVFDDVDLGVISPDYCSGGGVGSCCSNGSSTGVSCTTATNAGASCSGKGTIGADCSGGGTSVKCDGKNAGIYCPRGATGSKD